MAGQVSVRIYCCNPFDKDKHKACKHNLRPVTEWMCSMYDNIKKGMKICDSCRKQINKERNELMDNEDETINVGGSMPGPSNQDEEFVELDVSLEYLNKSLSTLGESPIAKKRLHTQSYCEQKVDKIKQCLVKKVLTQVETDNEKDLSSESEIITQLKEKFNEENLSLDKKIQILTVLPKSWTCKKIEDEFGVSNRMARKVKALVKENGILATPNSKPGKVLSNSVTQQIIQFYNSDDVSRLMPGKKDFVSVKTNDSGRIHVQKRLVLGNLKELYDLFKNKFPNEKIGFSKFAELRPKHCVLAGGSGTHSVCVCTIHQNTKLMMQCPVLKTITLNDGTALNDYKCYLAKIMCDEPGTACYLNECLSCPGIENLKKELHMKLDEEMVDYVTYKQWVTVDRCTFETATKTTEEFLDSLCEQLIVLKRHSFIAKKQSEYYNYVKENLKINEALVSFDFAENYAFVLQDEAQSFHWNNDQATIFPIAVYYKTSDGLKFKSIVCVSENLKHDTVAVHLFQKKLISYMSGSQLITNLEKIYYFSDGSAAQFKNRKNFSNICHHANEFNINVEWHFYATAHGKGVCDGLGGTVKRLAARASLQRPYEHQIMTPYQLFIWCKANILSTEFIFVSSQDHQEEETLLEERFLAAKSIPGTQKFHTFLPESDNEILAKVFSFSNESHRFSLSGKDIKQTLTFEHINGYVTCIYEDQWWLGLVLCKDSATGTVTLKFLHPAGPTPSFTYPQDEDVLDVPISDILTLVNPRCPTGRTYYLCKEEIDSATIALHLTLNN